MKAGQQQRSLVDFFGEVDVCNYLAVRAADSSVYWEFVASYVTRVDRISRQFGGRRLLIVTPVPPSAPL